MSAYPELRLKSLEANLALAAAKLAPLTWGNASERDFTSNVMAIKPSGVPYDELTLEDMALMEIKTGTLLEEKRRPSSDSPTHLVLYQAFAEVGGIVHTHSPYATAWAQAHRSIPVWGTTHADYFYGPVPITRPLTGQEIRGEYEKNTGGVIVEHFESHGINPLEMPAVLVAGHGPFVFGKTAAQAVENAIVLEEVARMASITQSLHPNLPPVSETLLDKHFLRKHGPSAYYGQK